MSTSTPIKRPFWPGDSCRECLEMREHTKRSHYLGLMHPFPGGVARDVEVAREALANVRVPESNFQRSP